MKRPRLLFGDPPVVEVESPDTVCPILRLSPVFLLPDPVELEVSDGTWSDGIVTSCASEVPEERAADMDMGVPLVRRI